MMEKKLRLGKLFLDFIKQNKILTIASIVFITSSGINIFLIYSFVQVLRAI